VRSTDHKAPRYVVFSTLLLPLPLRREYPPQHPIFEHPQPIEDVYTICVSCCAVGQSTEHALARCFTVSSYAHKQKHRSGCGFVCGSNPFGDLRWTTSTIMSEFRRSSWNFKRWSCTLGILVQSRIKVTGTVLTFVPPERMDSCGQAICHASPTICLLSQDAAT
jgi:hypothetical protein